MGSVSIDVKESERKLEQKFPMDTQDGIIAFLENYNHLQEDMYLKGDYDALIMIVDFSDALHNAGLTDLELLYITKVYVQDMKKVDVAKEFGVSKYTVQTRVARAVQKLAIYYKDGEST
ncbi:RNA polymerase sigma factor sigma-70 region 4 domain-containing protein [Halobacillus karajensis]|uniref:hypothetical protein n=1 Tax=Halobacillus karajensis TaxID=195088 RepID=UPI00045CAF08|nr:hypothetical protein [Halobacillus karajensis]CDQ21750.1 hypothetical protein BN982_04159 [Halobacillus karajensis]